MLEKYVAGANCRSGAIRRENIHHPGKRPENACALRKLRDIARWPPLISHESAFGSAMRPCIAFISVSA
jgi:hypothetical protein